MRFCCWLLLGLTLSGPLFAQTQQNEVVAPSYVFQSTGDILFKPQSGSYSAADGIYFTNSGGSAPSILITTANLQLQTHYRVDHMLLENNFVQCWSNGPDGHVTPDACFHRFSPHVLDLWSDVGGTAGAWLRPGGTARLTADVTNSTTVLASLSDLTIPNVWADAGSQHYVGVLHLICNESVANEGVKVDIAGTATYTNIEFGVTSAMGATVATRTSTSASTPVALSALADTSDVVVDIYVGFTVSGAGTVIPRVAQNSHSSGTVAVRKDSSFMLENAAN